MPRARAFRLPTASEVLAYFRQASPDTTALLLDLITGEMQTANTGAGEANQKASKPRGRKKKSGTGQPTGATPPMAGGGVGVGVEGTATSGPPNPGLMPSSGVRPPARTLAPRRPGLAQPQVAEEATEG